MDGIAIGLRKARRRTMQDSRSGFVEKQDGSKQLRVGGIFDSQEVPTKYRLQAFPRFELPRDLAMPIPKPIVQPNGKWHFFSLLPAIYRFLGRANIEDFR
jgi:hypothetical protein